MVILKHGNIERSVRKEPKNSEILKMAILQILSCVSREFYKFFRAINFCSYNKTHGFNKIFAFRIFAKIFSFHIFAKFRFVCASFIFVKKCEILRKGLQNAIENFRIFPETFCSLETLLPMLNTVLFFLT